MRPVRVVFTIIVVIALLAFLQTLKPESVTARATEPERFYVKCESDVLLTCVVYDKETKKSYVYVGSYRRGAGLVEIK